MQGPWLPAVVSACTFMLLLMSYKEWRDKQESLPACEMTYMYAKYEKVHLGNSSAMPEDAFGLYLYRDTAVSADSGTVSTPVLFIPGSGGKYAQGRALASEAMRHWSRQPGNKQALLDWYLVDTWEQLSAFDGDILVHQVDYVVACLRYLNHRYNASSRAHPGIVLIGHSMGGVVARAALAQAAVSSDLGPSTVALLITLASPHQRPPVPSHPSLQRFYAKLSSAGMPAVPIITLDGGYNDTQVDSSLTHLEGLVAYGSTFHTTSEAVPGSWAAAHHDCLVWCNQLVIRLTDLIAGSLKDLQQQRRLHQQASTSNPAAAKPGGQASHQLAVVTRHAQWQLQGSSWSKLNAGGVWSGAGGAAQAPGMLDEALQRFVGDQCTGTNLAWYQQYVSPAVVKGNLLRMTPEKVKASTKVGKLYRWALPPQCHAPATASSSTESAGAATTATTTAEQQQQQQCGDNNNSAKTGGEQCTASFALVLSGVKPCSGFRVWLHSDQTAAAVPVEDPSEAPGADKQAPRSIKIEASRDVTPLAAWLPPLVPEARRHVRDWAKYSEVMAGVDYNQSSAWSLTLPPSLLQGASGVTVWVGSPALHPAFSLVGQMWQQQQHPPQAPAAPADTLKLSLSSLTHPHHHPKGSPLRLHLDISLLPWFTSRAPATNRGTRQGAAGMSPGSLGASGGMPASDVPAMLSSAVASSQAWATAAATAMLGELHSMLQLRIRQHNAGDVPTNKATANCFHPVALFRGDALQEHVVANLTHIRLQQCFGASTSCRAVLLLDPACSYQVSLSIGLPSSLLRALLSRLHVLWALTQALLLLVVAHQAGQQQPSAAQNSNGNSTDNGRSTKNHITTPSSKPSILSSFLQTLDAVLWDCFSAMCHPRAAAAALLWSYFIFVSHQLAESIDWISTTSAAPAGGNFFWPASWLQHAQWTAARFFLGRAHPQHAVTVWLAGLPLAAACSRGPAHALKAAVSGAYVVLMTMTGTMSSSPHSMQPCSITEVLLLLLASVTVLTLLAVGTAIIMPLLFGILAVTRTILGTPARLARKVFARTGKTLEPLAAGSCSSTMPAQNRSSEGSKEPQPPQSLRSMSLAHWLVLLLAVGATAVHVALGMWLAAIYVLWRLHTTTLLGGQSTQQQMLLHRMPTAGVESAAHGGSTQSQNDTCGPTAEQCPQKSNQLEQQKQEDKEEQEQEETAERVLMLRAAPPHMAQLLFSWSLLLLSSSAVMLPSTAAWIRSWPSHSSMAHPADVVQVLPTVVYSIVLATWSMTSAASAGGARGPPISAAIKLLASMAFCSAALGLDFAMYHVMMLVGMTGLVAWWRI